MITGSDAAAVMQRRTVPAAALADDAEVISRACYAMARRFHAGGTLLVFGNGTSATDAAHIAVEFVHPVIVGKRALPAMSLANDMAAVTGVASTDGFADVFAAQIRLHARPGDIALGLSSDGNDENVLRALALAHDRGLLAVLMAGGRHEWPPVGLLDHVLRARSDDPLIVKEVQVTTYHVLWELVHVFFEQPGLLAAEVTA
jgi:D-sedoheptulose 7-phosphate isomerase